MTLYPTQLLRNDDGRLEIVWSNGQRRYYRPRQLRKNCPCATCREQREAEEQDKMKSLLRVISPEEAQPLTIARMEPVGHYAYKITFSDGHDTGIYTFDRLWELGEP